MKKAVTVTVTLLSTLVLAACGQSNSKIGQNNHSTTSSKNSSTQNGTRSNSTSSTNKQVQSTWNSSKKAKLATFMSAWGNTMDQQYESYYPGNNTDFYGIKFPAELQQDTIKLDNQTIDIEWSNTGTGTKPYQLVAIYCDSDTAEPMSEHLYFFVIHNGEPEVLITQQTNGDVQSDGLHFTQTSNKTLSSGFSKIVAGKTPATPAGSNDDSEDTSSSSESSSADDKITSGKEAIAAVEASYGNSDKNGKITWTVMQSGDNDLTTDENGDPAYWVRGQDQEYIDYQKSHPNSAGSYDGLDFYVYPDGTVDGPN